ncbi:unnamed protein product [Orchesella dallaii]|uniref:C2H2-type domain-containing protein n=1 Tax=Orchesella dallaii TaxID=48710 RepID=A0ABP1RJJ3_9HEXA
MLLAVGKEVCLHSSFLLRNEDRLHYIVLGLNCESYQQSLIIFRYVPYKVATERLVNKTVNKKTFNAFSLRQQNNSNQIANIKIIKMAVKCSVCQKTFKKPCQLTIHFRNHTGERPFPCKICNSRFKSHSQAKIHLKLHSDNRLTYSCLWCDKSFGSMDYMFTHYGAHTNEKPHFCKKCPNESFSTNPALRLHDYKKHGDKNKYKCEICNKSFFSSYKLKRHMIVHNKNGEKPYSCTICGKAYHQKSGLTTHSAVHSGTRPFKCLKCSKTFRHISNYKYHVKVKHSKLRPFKCEICDNSYKSKATRDQHTSSHLNEKPYLCSKCGNRFADSSGLRNHQKAYHENNRDVKCYACLFCAKRLTQKVELENHIRSHVNEKPYICSLCPFSAGHSAILKKHKRRTHEDGIEKRLPLKGEMEFECKTCKRKFKTKNRLIKRASNECGWIHHACIWCDKTFKSINGLTDHLRLHTNERPFYCKECSEVFSCLSKQNDPIFRKHGRGKEEKCRVCHKLFYTSYKLDAHRIVHTGEKPFSCPSCGKAFARKGDLTSHSAVHSKDRPTLSCTMCPKTFATKNYLKIHVSRAHFKLRPYPCEICGKRYFSKEGLNVHMESHLHEKPHKCQQCGKRYSHDSGLRGHLKRVHSNVGKVKCLECQRSFLDPNALKWHHLQIHTDPSERPLGCLFCTKRLCFKQHWESHVRTHIKEKPYFCEFCPSSFACSSNLTIHVKRMHKLDDL